eukprot:CAMPEP_0170238306 /NCGR_PEP_ID=MMETSP0116_2-20130129/18906_1 /TAXON_ID=400756 /ORGANISM="Durinskia baltica, Strain CSIRO CS-38" /LENGTH=365 /DNA_ID=CAMNT_0010489115 /DNA_START=36 /DNA_END=1133 /DNA_ORIENTATION=-
MGCCLVRCEALETDLTEAFVECINYDWLNDHEVEHEVRQVRGGTAAGTSDADEESFLERHIEIEEDDYDPRKPEYIEEVSAEEADRRNAELLHQQIAKLESSLKKRANREEKMCVKLTVHYETVLDEMRDHMRQGDEEGYGRSRAKSVNFRVDEDDARPRRPSLRRSRTEPLNFEPHAGFGSEDDLDDAPPSLPVEDAPALVSNARLTLPVDDIPLKERDDGSSTRPSSGSSPSLASFSTWSAGRDDEEPSSLLEVAQAPAQPQAACAPAFMEPKNEDEELPEIEGRIDQSHAVAAMCGGVAVLDTLAGWLGNKTPNATHVMRTGLPHLPHARSMNLLQSGAVDEDEDDDDEQDWEDDEHYFEPL